MFRRGSIESIATRVRTIVQQDPGKRGIELLGSTTHKDFLAATESIKEIRKQSNKKSAIILTGFPCLIDLPQPTETDGLLGSLVLGDALSRIGIPTCIITDSPNYHIIEKGLETWKEEIYSKHKKASEFSTHLFDSKSQNQSIQSYSQKFLGKNSNLFTDPELEVGIVIAIERAGASKDGNHYTMRGRSMDAIVDNLNELFLLAENNSQTVTIGIGDGGNELGMGSIKELTAKNSENGEKIACVIPAKHTLVAGTSDWGGFGLAALISILLKEESEWVFPDTEKLKKVLQSMVDKGASDGISKQGAATVDGLDWKTYSQVIIDLSQILTEENEIK